ncbi:MAG: PEGA domain-containing protein [Deltaproteobacteria bacterium]|nr:PEGA domain-containing protein [Deltaproteobacteria bacterium]
MTWTTGLVRAAAFAVVLASGLPRSVGAQAEEDASRAEAERHFEAGIALMRAEDWDAARIEFERSIELFPTRSALFNLGMCRKALHLYREALQAFEEWQARYGGVADAPELEAAAAAMAELRVFLGTLTVRVEPPGAAIVVDEEPIGTAPLAAPLEVQVGRHTIQVTLDGHRPWTGEAIVASGEDAVVTVVLDPVAQVVVEPPPVAPPAPPPIEPADVDAGVGQAWFWTAAGTAVALGIGGAVTGVLVGVAAEDYDAALPGCRTGDGDACAAGLDAVDRHDAYQIATWVLLPAAVVAAVAAGVLAGFTDWEGEPTAAGVAVTVGPTASSGGTPDGFAVGALVRF